MTSLRISHVVFLVGVLLAAANRNSADFVVNEDPLKVDLAQAVDPGSTVALVSTSKTPEFTLIRPDVNCQATSADSVEISFGKGSNCKLSLAWSTTKGAPSGVLYVDSWIAVTSTDVRFKLEKNSTWSMKYNNDGAPGGKSLSKCDGIWEEREGSFTTDFTTRPMSTSCGKMPLQFGTGVRQAPAATAADAKAPDVQEQPVGEAPHYSPGFIVLIILGGILIVLVVVALVYFFFCGQDAGKKEKRGKHGKKKKRDRRSREKTTVTGTIDEETATSRTRTVTQTQSAVQSGVSGVSGIKSTVKKNKKSLKAKSSALPSTQWDIKKDVSPGPLDYKEKFDRMIHYKSKRKSIEYLNFYTECNIIMLPEPGKKYYKISVEVDNQNPRWWCSFIVRYGAQYMRLGEASECVRQGKQQLVAFVRDLQPWQGYELIVYQMKRFPIRRWGGLPFKENVEYYHRVEHDTCDFFLYVTEMMTEEEAAKFYAERLAERRAMVKPQNRDFLPKTFKTKVAVEAKPGVDF